MTVTFFFRCISCKRTFFSFHRRIQCRHCKRSAKLFGVGDAPDSALNASMEYVEDPFEDAAPQAPEDAAISH